MCNNKTVVSREMKPVTLWTCAHTVSIIILPVFTFLLDEDTCEEQSLDPLDSKRETPKISSSLHSSSH